MANWTVFIPGRGNIVVDGTEEDLNKTLEQYAQSRGASQEKQQKGETLDDLVSQDTETPTASSSLYNEADVTVPWQDRIAKGYNYLTNQDIKNIKEGSWTGTGTAATLNALDETLGSIPSRTLGAARSAIFGKKAGEETKAWREIQLEEHPAAVIGGMVGITALASALTGGGATGPMAAKTTATAAKTAATTAKVTKLGKVAEKVGEGARPVAKIIEAPIAGGRWVKNKVAGETLKSLTEGNMAKRVTGRFLGGAIEGGTIGAEFALANELGIGIDQAAGIITTDQAMEDYIKGLYNAPYAVATGAVIGGAIPTGVSAIGGTWKLGKTAYQKILNRIHVNEGDVEAFNRIVGPENVKNAVAVAQAVIDEGRAQAELEKTMPQLEDRATDAFWGALFKNIEPSKSGDLLHQVRRNPELSEKVVKFLTPVKEGLKGETLGLIDKDFAVLSAEVNKLLGNVYGAAPEGIVQQLGDDFVKDALGRSSRMADTRKATLAAGAKEVRERVNSENSTGEGLFSTVRDEYKFKGKSKQVLSKLALNAKDAETVRGGVVFDEIPSYKPGTQKGDAFARQVRKAYEDKVLKEVIAENEGVGLMGLSLTPEQVVELEEKAKASPLYKRKLNDVNAWNDFERRAKLSQQYKWFDDIVTNGTDDVDDLLYLKEVGNNSLKKINPDNGQITNWGKVNKETNNLLREYSGEGGIMRTALNVETMGDTFEQLYALGKNYGKGTQDLSRLTGLLFDTVHDTPVPANGVAARAADQIANRTAGEAFFKVGLMEQLQNAALDGDIEKINSLIKIMRSSGGNGLAGHITTEEIWNAANRVMPIARANGNIKDLLRVANSTPVSEGQQSWGPYVRSFLGWLTGSRNTMMNALVTILDRYQWNGATAKALMTFVEKPTAETLNTLVNSTSKDPLTHKQLGRMFSYFLLEEMPKLAEIGADVGAMRASRAITE